jgi:hypothetical protein
MVQPQRLLRNKLSLRAPPTKVAAQVYLHLNPLAEAAEAAAEAAETKNLKIRMINSTTNPNKSTKLFANAKKSNAAIKNS